MSIRKPGRVRSAAALVAAATTVLLTGCVGGAATAPGDAGGTTLHLVGFAVPKEANNAIQKKFAETEQGKGVTWQESYGPSGDQSRAVVNGLKADYVNFSLEGDVTRLVKAGLVTEDWKSGPTKGIVSDSVVVIVVQKGNPKISRAGSDLTKPGVKIVTPNPASSGSARWNILAAYQQVIANGGTEADAKAYLTKFFQTSDCAAGQRTGRDQRLPARLGQCADLVRERGHSGSAVGRGLRLHRARHHTARSKTRRSPEGRESRRPTPTSTSC